IADAPGWSWNLIWVYPRFPGPRNKAPHITYLDWLCVCLYANSFGDPDGTSWALLRRPASISLQPAPSDSRGAIDRSRPPLPPTDLGYRRKLFAFEWENPHNGRKKQLTWTRLPQGFKNSPTLFGNQLAKELESWTMQEKFQLPKQVAIMHCKAHQGGDSKIAEGNALADRTARRIARQVSNMMALIPTKNSDATTKCPDLEPSVIIRKSSTRN
ncbi:uncharacterized protein LOC128850194, partial [Cuculus canorus]|uniref:uncharacterized protein LOC128850194 n=1 Tax=Cuculus canorus TaxID=55661 RepID=UPI0023AAE208